MRIKRIKRIKGMRGRSLFLLCATVFLASVCPKQSESVPAFTRQTKLPCTSCHYQFFPQLNAFGRAFKLGGFTQTEPGAEGGGQNADATNINAAVMIDSGLLMGGNGGLNGDNNGNWQIGNEPALFAGGRIGPNTGALVKISRVSDNFKFVYSDDGPGSRRGVVVYRTATGGPGYSMDYWNTGSDNAGWGWRGGNDLFITRAFGPNSGTPAEGIHLFYGTREMFLNFGAFAPVGDNLNGVGGAGANVGANLAKYFRLAWSPTVIYGVDFMLGAQTTFGTATLNGGENYATQGGGPNGINIDANSTLYDAQAQWDLAGRPAQLTIAHALIPAESFNNKQAVAVLTSPQNNQQSATLYSIYKNGIYNTRANAISGFDASFSLAISKKFGFKTAYGSLTGNGTSCNVTDCAGYISGVDVGGWWNASQNIKLAIEEVFYFGNTNLFGPSTASMHETSATTLEFEFLF
ncbi:MAG: hypothetical protein HY280_08895 [Nitrospinae bacterium]|nr:hypothetical protein [Nitrospinota bacterium]